MAGGFFGFEVLRPDIRSRWSSRYVLNPPQTIPPHLTRSWQKLRTKIEKIPFFGLFWPIFYCFHLILQHCSAFSMENAVFWVTLIWLSDSLKSLPTSKRQYFTVAFQVNKKYNGIMVIPQALSLHMNTHSTFTSNRTKLDNITSHVNTSLWKNYSILETFIATRIRILCILWGRKHFNLVIRSPKKLSSKNFLHSFIPNYQYGM